MFVTAGIGEGSWCCCCIVARGDGICSCFFDLSLQAGTSPSVSSGFKDLHCGASSVGQDSSSSSSSTGSRRSAAAARSPSVAASSISVCLLHYFSSRPPHLLRCSLAIEGRNRKNINSRGRDAPLFTSSCRRQTPGSCSSKHRTRSCSVCPAPEEIAQGKGIGGKPLSHPFPSSTQKASFQGAPFWKGAPVARVPCYGAPSSLDAPSVALLCIHTPYICCCC